MNEDKNTNTLNNGTGTSRLPDTNELTLDVSAIDDIPVLEPDAIPLLGNTVPIAEKDQHQERAKKIDELDVEVEEMILDLGYESDDSAQGSDDDFEVPTLNANDAENNQITINPDDELNYTGDDLFIDHEERRHQNAGTTSEIEGKDLLDDTEQAVTAAHNTFSLADVAPTLAPSNSYSNDEPTKAAPHKDENPFLPKHLRERLDKSKQNLLEEITRSSEALSASSSLLKSYQQPKTPEPEPQPELDEAVTQNSHKLIIDALVAQYLPIIEAELRRKLNKTLEDAKPRKFKPSFQRDE